MIYLVLGAHYDDAELGCGGTIAKAAAAGHEVHIYVATDSGFNALDSEPIRSGDTARVEAKTAARILGADLHHGSFETFCLQYGDELNASVLRLVEEIRPDVVLSVGVHDVHSDHWALAKAAENSCRHVPRLATYRCNWYTGSTRFDGRLFVDVTDSWETKVAAIRCYRSEWNRAGRRWADYFGQLAETDGRAVGVERAECFHVVRWLVDSGA